MKTTCDHPVCAGGDFWKKFGSDAPKSFSDLRVLEIGCGVGSRALELARAGALVTGVDLSAWCIAEAMSLREKQPPELAHRLTFRECRMQDLSDGAFDAVISEDTFEHIMDVPEVLADIRNKLAVGGRAYIGFGPLYHSPRGDHGWMQPHLPFGSLPWSHLFLPKSMTYRMVGRKIGASFDNTVDWPYLTLNQHTVADFTRMFNESGMRLVSIRNVKHASVAGKIFDAFGRVPFLKKYFTDGIYCVLEKTDANPFVRQRRGNGS